MQVRVRGRRRVQDERAHVADVGHPAEQLDGVVEALGGRGPAGEGERRARRPGRGAGNAGRVVRGMRLQPGIVDAHDLGLRLQPAGDRQRRVRLPLHAQRQRLDALLDEERVHRRQHRPEQRRDDRARERGVGGGAVLLHVARPLQPLVRPGQVCEGDEAQS